MVGFAGFPRDIGIECDIRTGSWEGLAECRVHPFHVSGHPRGGGGCQVFGLRKGPAPKPEEGGAGGE